MASARDFDYTPLTRRVGWTARLMAIGANNVMVMGGTVGVLLVVVPLAILIGLIATDNATDTGGLLVLALCLGGGVYALVDVWRKSGAVDALGGFASANDLTLLRGATVPHYAGSLFADQSHAVYHSVRTRDAAFVEVGERIPTTSPRRSDEPNRSELFLRARLQGPVTRNAADGGLVPSELDEALGRFAGTYSIEVSGDELTLFGSRGLEVETPGRVEHAFALAAELVTLVHAPRVPSRRVGVPEAFTEPLSARALAREGSEPPAPGRRRRPLTVVAWTVALIVGFPVVVAVVVSMVDDGLRGEVLVAQVLVSLVTLAALALVGWVLRAALSRRSDRRRRE